MWESLAHCEWYYPWASGPELYKKAILASPEEQANTIYIIFRGMFEFRVEGVYMRGEEEEREGGIIELYYNFNIKNHKNKNTKKMSL